MIDPALREVLDLAVRWVHVIAGILWIGNSMLWNWIDRNLEKPDDANAIGKIWLLHSGAFYRMEKTLLVGQSIPKPLHWFKWQAYTTWLSGAVLLVLVYYVTGGALLLGAEHRVENATAIAIGAGLILLAWPAYDLIWRSPVKRSRIISGAFGLALILGIAYGLTRVFSGRATFLHVGAMLATIMAGNVFRIIMPSQRQMLASFETGHGADKSLSDRAKARSIHNNYLTYPVIGLMVSSHFPGLYGHHYNWLLLGVIVVAGASARHFMNIRFTNARWGYGLAGTVVAALAILLFATREITKSRNHEMTSGSVVTFADARHGVDRRCGACHSVAPSDKTFGAAPAGVTFDTPENIRAFAPRILQRAVKDRTMPPGNKTSITDGEREILGRWINAGAKIQ